MSKLTKLINSPVLFITDAIKKRSKPLYNLLVLLGLNPNDTFLANNDVNILNNYILLHTGEKESALSHINLWYPYFVDSGVNFIIVTRFIEAYNEIKRTYPEAIVVYARNKKDIDVLFDSISSIKGCFYPSNTGKNAHLLYQLNTKHIFIGHGDSDKSASAHKYFRAYDENWVAGEAHIDRFKNAKFSLNGLKHVKVGRPTLFDLLVNANTEWKQGVADKINLLYLPTWEGVYKEQDYSSLGLTVDILQKIMSVDYIDVSIKLHPSTGRRERKFSRLEKKIQQIAHNKQKYKNNTDLAAIIDEYPTIRTSAGNNRCHVISKQENLSHHIKQSNIFICDISAVVSECLAINAPIFLFMPKDKKINIARSNMCYSEYCYVFSTAAELLDKIFLVLSGNDYLSDNRRKAAEYIINIEDTLNHTFIKKLQALGN